MVDVPISPVDFYTGIVPEVFDVPVQPGDPSVFVAATRIANFATYGLPAVATNAGSGAGLVRHDAWMAAVCESLERYACAVMDAEIVVGTHRELTRSGRKATEPSGWALFSADQLRSGTPYSSFEPDTVLGWCPADDLRRRTEVLVPACLVYMPYRRQHEDEAVVGFSTSTGLACARSVEDALLGGLCEVIERDAFAITWRNRLRAREIVVDRNSALHEIYAERFHRPHVEMRLFTTTLDAAIPSVFGYARDYRNTPATLTTGGAAHPDPDVAVLKTLLELVQGMQWVNTTAKRSFPVVPGFTNVHSFTDHLALYAFNDIPEAFSFLHDDPRGMEPLSEMESRYADVLGIDEVIESCEAQGLDVLACDLTPVDVAATGMRVIKTLVPQAECLEGDARYPYLGGARPSRFTGSVDPEAIGRYPHPYP